MHRAAKQTVILFLVALAAVSLAACDRTGSGATGASADPSVAATVNGKNIPLSEVDQLISQQTQGKQAEMSQLQLAQARIQVLDRLIQNEVLFQRAEKEKLLPTEDEITQFINSQMQQANMTQEQFQKRLKEQNQTLESLREEARKQIAIQKLQDKTNGKVGVPSDKEVEDFYNANKQQFVSQRGVALAEISVDPGANEGMQDDAKSDAEAKQKIDLIYQQLKSGADFATVARARSEDTFGPRGGNIGFATEEDLKRNGFPPELISKLMGSEMQVGSYTEPVLIRSIWFIFKLQGRQLQTENRTLDSPEVRSQITEALINQRKQILNTALLEVAMNEAEIQNNLATKMLTNPDNFGLPRPAQPAGTAATPAASPAGQASPQATGSPTPGATDTATPSPTAQASPSPKS